MKHKTKKEWGLPLFIKLKIKIRGSAWRGKRRGRRRLREGEQLHRIRKRDHCYQQVRGFWPTHLKILNVDSVMNIAVLVIWFSCLLLLLVLLLFDALQVQIGSCSLILICYCFEQLILIHESSKLSALANIGIVLESN
jgi:hypothetical protein